MAHFAEIDNNNIVLRVIVIANEDTYDQYGNENEDIGAKFCHDLLGGTWIKTSYNHNIRGTFAGIEYTYDPLKDEFIPPVEGDTDAS